MAFLRKARGDVEPGRIGGIGLSVGGEMMLQTAAGTPGLGGGRVRRRRRPRPVGGVSDVSGLERLIGAPTLAVKTAALALFSNTAPSKDLTTYIARIAPRPIMLIHAAKGEVDDKTPSTRPPPRAGGGVGGPEGRAHRGRPHDARRVRAAGGVVLRPGRGGPPVRGGGRGAPPYCGGRTGGLVVPMVNSFSQRTVMFLPAHRHHRRPHLPGQPAQPRRGFAPRPSRAPPRRLHPARHLVAPVGAAWPPRGRPGPPSPSRRARAAPPTPGTTGRRAAPARFAARRC